MRNLTCPGQARIGLAGPKPCSLSMAQFVQLLQGPLSPSCTPRAFHYLVQCDRHLATTAFSTGHSVFFPGKGRLQDTGLHSVGGQHGRGHEGEAGPGFPPVAAWVWVQAAGICRVWFWGLKTRLGCGLKLTAMGGRSPRRCMNGRRAAQVCAWKGWWEVDVKGLELAWLG